MKKKPAILNCMEGGLLSLALAGAMSADAAQLLRYDFTAGSAVPSFTAENVAGSSTVNRFLRVNIHNQE